MRGTSVPAAAVESEQPRAHSEYTIGWVCALPKEMTAAVAMLDAEHPNLDIPVNDQNVYTLGSIGKHNIVIACLPKGIIGTCSAAVVATQMVNTFPNIKFGLMVGIGGGIPPQVRLGDVVVGTPSGEYPGVVQWDLGKATESKGDGGGLQRTGALNHPPRSLLAALSKLGTDHERYGSNIPQYLAKLGKKYPKLATKYLRSELLKDLAFKKTARHVDRSTAIAEGIVDPDEDDDEEEEGEEEDSCRFCDKTQTLKNNNKEMRVHYGLIASGNQVIKNAEFRNEISKSLGGVLCLEMEAAGLLNAFPCLVIRGICDYADAHKNKAWQEHAAAVAAAFAKELLGYVQGPQVDQELSVRDILDELSPTVSRIDENVKSVKRRLDKEEDRQIFRWLTETDYGNIQDDKISQRTEGTGGWVLKSAEFLEWYRDYMQTLFCPGDPGTGKSIITAIIVDWLLDRKNHENGDIGVAYIYFDYKRPDEQKVEKCLASLLRQLTQRSSEIPSILKEFYQRYQDDGRRPKIDEYLQALSSVATLYSKVFIVVDALDECQLDARQELLTRLFEFQLKSRANVFATSRHIHDIEARFTGPALEITGSKYDLQKYLEANLPSLQGMLEKESQLWEEIKRKIIGEANGVFLLVRLRLDSFKGFVTKNEVRRALREDSKGSRGIYDKTYDEVMDRIKCQREPSPEHAIRALSWITGAKRQLTISEFQHAFAIQVGQSSLDKDDIPDLGGLTFACCGLIAVDKQSNIIRLVHYTAQEYLMKEKRLPDMEKMIAENCITYLAYDLFRDQGVSPTTEAFDERFQSNPLYNYAADFWGYHVRTASIEDKSSTLGFLKSETAVSACSQALRGFHISRWTWMHLCAYFGMESSIRAMQPSKEVLGTKDDYNRTPLSLAAERGHQAVVQLLVEAKVNLDTKDSRYGQTPLSLAAEEGHQAVVQLLIEAKADVEAEDNSNRTPLSWAAENGHQAVAQLLVEAKANLEAKDSEYGRMPLLLAAEKGHQAVVQLLIKAGADLEGKDSECGLTPLLWAAANGHQAVAQLLVEAKANLEAKDSGYGRTPLSLAAEEGHQAVVQLLIEAKADVKAEDNYNRTPLLFAAKNGHQVVVQLLVEAKANLDTKDSRYGQTPLSLAAENGHQAVVQLLVEAGADLEANDNHNRTPLSWAVVNNHKTVMQLLSEAKDNQQKRHVAPPRTTLYQPAWLYRLLDYCRWRAC
ncbi:hypothetical protein TWF694_000216 [Orbilia ellipsospora]|uniref:Nucleoside phosphorylase domain-containing protein n=1 Tax=Orbilia ellipsospora TaxID=2528407 RepID=A0AAV9XMY7_9PEZI